MDYKEKYEQALERAKDFMNGKVHYALKKGENIMCWVFPELCESEDERIRQLLIRFVAYDMSDNYSDDFTPADCVAWLEKQGEQKSMKTCAEYYNQDNELKMPELSEFQDKLADILMYREYDGPDETEDDIAKGRLEYELAAIRLSEELLPLAQKEQKPAWSGEDEKYLDGIIANLEYLMDRANADTLKQSLQKRIDWLKSIRPHSQWKPSDEQMEALEHFVRSICESGYASPYDNNTKVLYSLLSDLKKLKG